MVATATVVAGGFGNSSDRKTVVSADTGIEVDGESETIDPAFNASHSIFENKAKSMSSIAKTGLYLSFHFMY